MWLLGFELWTFGRAVGCSYPLSHLTSPYFSLISLNINRLNVPIKRHRLTDWLHKQDPTFCCLQETYLKEKDRHYLRVKGWKTTFQANGLKKQDGVAILISNKIDFQPKVIKKKKKRRGTLNSSKVKSSKRNSQF
jgi:exonuclease III